ncbi:heterokaryon incompatibility protein-domain-containing protein [Stachybotrys elegans]|uniref:Heterokaryon incompatibility protein-domain-containing protein n=1 Tax=Stachybotrys elegans TaxID=80388 RepID=A0A8K0WJR7_9HYPO|nr:heterokaryon incompatibility protein-domain-containing protein [Stachybotrys elegans]
MNPPLPPRTHRPLEFTYPFQLQPGQIRLLWFMPGLKQDGLMHFRFETVNLPPEGSPEPCKLPYCALSYVWGKKPSSDDSYLIRIDGQIMPIRPNLFSALIDLTPELASQNLPIWVDAACIQQLPRDNPEKDGQLPWMGQVYRKAFRVIVHLGIPLDNVAFQYMCELGRDTYDMGVTIFRDGDLAFWPDFEGRLDQQAKVRIRKNLEHRMDAIQGNLLHGPLLPVSDMLALLDRPWFSRAWIIQEITLPEGGVVFACGPSQRISSHHLWGAYFFLVAWILREGRRVEEAKGFTGKVFRFVVFRKRLGMKPRDISSRATITMGLRKKVQDQPLGLCLKSVLVKLHVGDSEYALGCELERDAVVAVMSLANDKDWVHRILRPNTEWQEFLTDLSRELIKRGHIDLLSLCRHRHTGLPSWVVDWTRQQWAPWLGLKNVEMGDHEQLFNAARGTTVICYESNLPRILNLRGFRLDTILQVSLPMPNSAVDPSGFSMQEFAIRLAQLRAVLQASLAYTPEQKAEALWRIPVADKEMNRFGQITRATDMTKQEICNLQQSIESGSPLAYFTGATSSSMNMLLALFGSRVLTTPKGYVGLCHINTKAGDTIFIPNGSHCPYAIRHVDHADGSRTWKLLGEAYVYGVMDDELRLADRQGETEVFSLE